MSAQMVTGGVQLKWSSGTLLQATSVSGPWTPVTGATSPYVTSPTGPQKFFKVQVQ